METKSGMQQELGSIEISVLRSIASKISCPVIDLPQAHRLAVELLRQGGHVSVKDGVVRPTVERYYTPNWVVDLCMKHVVPVTVKGAPSYILEPGAGKGVFVEACRREFPEAFITAVDNDFLVAPSPLCDEWIDTDFLKTTFQYTAPHRSCFDLAIGNPPFSLAQEFVEHSLKYSDMCIFLLRLGFLASAKRAKFFEEYQPTHVFTLPNRPSFAGAGTDSYDYAFVVWGSPYSLENVTQWNRLPVLPKKERKSLCVDGSLGKTF